MTLNDPVMTAVEVYTNRRSGVWCVRKTLGVSGWSAAFVCSDWARRRFRRDMRRREARAAKRRKAKGMH